MERVLYTSWDFSYLTDISRYPLISHRKHVFQNNIFWFLSFDNIWEAELHEKKGQKSRSQTCEGSHCALNESSVALGKSPHLPCFGFSLSLNRKQLFLPPTYTSLSTDGK